MQLKIRIDEIYTNDGHRGSIETFDFRFKMKLNIIFKLFRFSFSLSNRETNFKSELRFSIKIEVRFLCLRMIFRDILFAGIHISSVRSHKLPF